jgi:ribonuclease P protein component
MTARHGQGFPKAARIRRRREFLSLGRNGEKRRTASFVVVSQATGMAPRLGITVSRKVGGAVTRNLLKRRIREAFRRHPDRLRIAGDLVVIAKAGVGAIPMSAVQREFSMALKVPGSRQRSDRQ